MKARYFTVFVEALSYLALTRSRVSHSAGDKWFNGQYYKSKGAKGFGESLTV